MKEQKGFFRFVPASFSDKLRPDTNPGRGWLQVFTFDVEDSINGSELFWSLNKNERLALALLDLSCCRGRKLNETEINNVRKIFEFFSVNRTEIVLRPLYDREGKALEKEPASFSVVLEHIRQIGALANEYSPIIHTLQGLFVGNWGEMHGSGFLSAGQMKILAETLYSACGKTCFLSVRTPLQRRLLAGAALDIERVGLFDDGLFGSPTHLGTFGTDESGAADRAWTAEKELDYLDRSCRFAPNGGETVYGGEYKPEEIISTLGRMHFTYLNRVYDSRVLEKWKCTPAGYGMSLYDHIGLRLGYRFLVEDAYIEEDGADITAFVSVKNTGFGCLLKRAEAFFELHCGGRVSSYGPLDADLRKLAPGESVLLARKIKCDIREKNKAELYLCLIHENGELIYTANSPDSGKTLAGTLLAARPRR